MFWLSVLCAGLLLLFQVPVETLSLDYCTYFPCGRRHIFCEPGLTISQFCPERPRLINITEQLDYILYLHNNFRNAVAGGKIQELEPAARMATMRWDLGLERAASIQASFCLKKIHSCHGTSQFPASSQNVAMNSYTGKMNSVSLEEVFKDQINYWFGNIRWVTQNIVNVYPEVPEIPSISNATIMVRDDNTHVGCGASRFSANGRWIVLLICNYAQENEWGYPVYESSYWPASACRTGMNPMYPNLCSPEESYHVLENL